MKPTLFWSNLSFVMLQLWQEVFFKDDSTPQLLRFYTNDRREELIQRNGDGRLNIVFTSENMPLWTRTYDKVLRDGNNLFLLGVGLDNQSVVIAKYSDQLVLQDVFSISDSYFIVPTKLIFSSGGDKLLLLAAFEDQSSRMLKSRLIEMDIEGNIFWSKNAENYYIDIVAVPDKGYLALSQQDSVTKVSLLNNRGEQMEAKEYIHQYDQARKIQLDESSLDYYILGDYQVLANLGWEMPREVYIIKDRFDITSVETLFRQDDGIKIYPNPVRDWLTVSVIGSSLSNNMLQKKIVIRSVNGKIVFTTYSESNWVNLNLVDIPSGIYFLNIPFGENRLVRRMIKY
ncbi:MAG: T9SS type A sorting domain-containing protein [Bacteroidota bacterium]